MSLSQKRSKVEPSARGASPIRDIMSGTIHETIRLSEEETEFIRQIVSNPEPPTQELIDALSKTKQQKARFSKSVA